MDFDDFETQDLNDIQDMDSTSSRLHGYCSGCGNGAPVGSRCCDGESVDPA